MDIIRMQTSKISKWENYWQFVMLHHTWVIWEWNIDYLLKNKAEVSCHFLVMQDWRVYQFADLDQITRHAGRWKYAWVTDNMNKYAIGIEIESDGYVFTDIQREKVKELLIKFDFDYNLIRHKDYSDKKWDVWDNFWNNKYWSWEEYKLSIYNDTSISKDRSEQLKTQKTYINAMQKIMEIIIRDKALEDQFIDETITYVNICSSKIKDIDNQLEKNITN